jgi:hypothetical protein
MLNGMKRETFWNLKKIEVIHEPVKISVRRTYREFVDKAIPQVAGL